MSEQKTHEPFPAQGQKSQGLKPSIVIAFVLSLAFYGSALLHFHTALLCKTHRNPVSFPDEKEDFKAAVAPLVPSLQVVAIANIVHVILNAILLLFGTSSSHSHPFVVGIILGVAGVISCLSATIGVMGVASRWNRMHGSAYSLKLYTSVFIGDLSEFQQNFKLQVFMGFLLFLPINVYLIYFWGRSLSTLKKPGRVYQENQEKHSSIGIPQNDDKSMENSIRISEERSMKKQKVED